MQFKFFSSLAFYSVKKQPALRHKFAFVVIATLVCIQTNIFTVRSAGRFAGIKGISNRSCLLFAILGYSRISDVKQACSGGKHVDR